MLQVVLTIKVVKYLTSANAIDPNSFLKYDELDWNYVNESMGCQKSKGLKCGGGGFV